MTDPADPGDALAACGLPQAWRGHRQWRILSTDFGLGEDFFKALDAWRTDPDRPERLHCCARVTTPLPNLIDGLPGFHRLAFDGGQVSLTLCVPAQGEPLRDTLRELDFHADTVWTDTDVHGHLKTLARCCARGSSLLMRLNANRYSDPNPNELQRLRNALRQCGWVEGAADSGLASSPFVAATPPTVANALIARYDPAWVPRRAVNTQAPGVSVPTGHAIVIGAGLAGAAVAHSLARRGWQVTVLDAASAPAQGTSALPAGLAVPQVSPDDNTLSRLSRSGLRLVTQFAHDHLRAGLDWSPSGVMENLDVAAPQHETWTVPVKERPSPSARFHPNAAWFKPAALVAAWLNHPGIRWVGNQSVQRLHSASDDSSLPPTWQVLGSNEAVIAEGDIVVLCAALACKDLLPRPKTKLKEPALPLQAVRGVATWAHHGHIPMLEAPTHPVNGHGSYISHVPMSHIPTGDNTAGDGTTSKFWITGAGYERNEAGLQLDAAALASHHAINLQRLALLLPDAVLTWATNPSLHAFVGIRCTTPDRLPAAGAVTGQPGLWVSTGMGSRGLTFAGLCAELIAALLHGEPLPLEARLARALSPQRWV